jgi:mannitol 2-dehydrogenase
MVDRIVPATSPEDIATLADKSRYLDRSPVIHEPFRQWVIEDDFCAGRPEWDSVGATFTDDVHDYEVMKIRILNGGHQIIATLGELLSIETIVGCMRHKKIAALFSRIAKEEIAPHVKTVPGISSLAYVDLIAQRFSNPRIVDTTRRVAFDGASRHPGFVIPSIRDGLLASTPIDGLALVEAAWARMCAGTRQDGSRIEPNDPSWDELQAVALASRADPLVWLSQSQYYHDLAQQPGFRDVFSKWLRMMWQDGVEATIEAYLAY